MPTFHQSMTAPLKKVLVRRPDAAFGNADPQQWHYASQPDLAAAQAEHDAFCQTMREAGAEVVYHEEALPEHADSIFVYDPVLLVNDGAILLSLGKELRRGEESAIGKTLEGLGVPVVGQITGEGRVEGGDLCWLDDRTLAAGRTFRTNAEGLRQLRELLEPRGVTMLTYDMPYGDGPEACLHLMSVISPVAPDAAVIYPRWMPVALWQELQQRGWRLIEVPDEEYATMASNVLALNPTTALMLEGNPVTKQRLEDAGFTVKTYKGEELSFKAEGGPTCLTKPLLRG